MSISRRSFLKLAGLTTVAVAGTALFTGCTIASYLQIELSDAVYAELAKGDNSAEDIQKVKDFMESVNLGLKAVPLVGVTSMKKADLEEIVYSTIRNTVADPEKAEEICNMIVIEGDDILKAEDKLYGAITIKVTLKNVKTQAAELAEAVA